jgi:gamma-glutamyltranspeptidase/glutathione hydrolase
MGIPKKVTQVVAVVAGLLVLFYLLLPKGPREQMGFEDPWRQARPMVTAEEYIVVTGTPWATAAAIDILEKGGNAFDAASAALLALNVTYGEAASFPSVAPLLIHDAVTGKVQSYVGAGTAPAKATIELYRQRGHETVPLYSTLSQVIPASPDVLISMLSELGTMRFQEISQAAITLARQGFPVHMSMLRNLKLSLLDRIGFHFILPYASEVYLRGEWWRPLHFDDRFIRPDLADTFEDLVQAEKEALADGLSREEALQAVRDYFYTGPIANKIVEFHRQNEGLFSSTDLANYKGGWETPLKGSFGDYEIFTNGTWSQGIVVPMIMQILEPMNLSALGHNSPEYIHTVLQAIELTMADREAYVADSRFVGVPVRELLERGFADQRRQMMRANAFGQMPKPGIPAGGVPVYAKVMLDSISNNIWPVPGSYTPEGQVGKDTSYIAIIDRHGNSVSLTPSDFPTSPMVPGTGLTLGVRMTQFRLLAGHPASLEPGKRPRITPHAVMLFKSGKYYMSIGTPGGDMQAQANVQVLLNHIVFGMDIQSAIEAPRFRSNNFPDSFAPHVYRPGSIELERSLQGQASALEDLGYQVEIKDDWENSFGAVGAVITDGNQLKAGADPREETWAQGR